MMLFVMLNGEDIVNKHLTKIIYVFELTILPVTANALSIIFADNHCTPEYINSFSSLWM